MKTKEDKIRETVQDWIFSHIQFMLYDCCDSMHEEENLEAKFDGLVNESQTITDYIRANLRESYKSQVMEEFEQDEYSDLEDLECFRIPYSEFKDW